MPQKSSGVTFAAMHLILGGILYINNRNKNLKIPRGLLANNILKYKTIELNNDWDYTNYDIADLFFKKLNSKIFIEPNIEYDENDIILRKRIRINLRPESKENRISPDLRDFSKKNVFMAFYSTCDNDFDEVVLKNVDRPLSDTSKKFRTQTNNIQYFGEISPTNKNPNRFISNAEHFMMHVECLAFAQNATVLGGEVHSQSVYLRGKQAASCCPMCYLYLMSSSTAANVEYFHLNNVGSWALPSATQEYKIKQSVSEQMRTNFSNLLYKGQLELMKIKPNKNNLIANIRSLSSFEKNSNNHVFTMSEIEDGINILNQYSNNQHGLLQICIEGVNSLPHPIWLYLVTILKAY